MMMMILIFLNSDLILSFFLFSPLLTVILYQIQISINWKWPACYLVWTNMILTSFCYYYLLLNNFLTPYFVCVCVSLSSYVYHLCIDKDEADNAITLCNIFTNSKNNNWCIKRVISSKWMCIIAMNIYC